ncbi:MAG: hypothetical protein WCX90_05890 [Thiohalomonadaceae bacterium]
MKVEDFKITDQVKNFLSAATRMPAIVGFRENSLSPSIRDTRAKGKGWCSAI